MKIRPCYLNYSNVAKYKPKSVTTLKTKIIEEKKFTNFKNFVLANLALLSFARSTDEYNFLANSTDENRQKLEQTQEKENCYYKNKDIQQKVKKI